jgi:hypothetical protein
MLEEFAMVDEKQGKKETEINGAMSPSDTPQVKHEDSTSIVQIDDSELPQSIKDKFKD